MTEAMNSSILILFSGLPGTLKTFISSRLAHRLGCLWLPTFGFGNIVGHDDTSLLKTQRSDRYEYCVHALRFLSGTSARVVVEGGFMDTAVQRQVFSSYMAHPKLLIRCVANTDSRTARLRKRMHEHFDPEQSSARSILNKKTIQPALSKPDMPETPESLGCDAIIELDTTSFRWKIEGMLDPSLLQRIDIAIMHAFSEFRVTDKLIGRDALKQNFGNLASHYEESTEWRTDPTLLSQLRLELPPLSQVLDIGAGTGLASQWYTDQGHRCIGVDLSPQMSVRAASRLVLTNFGSAVDLPFFDESFNLALMRQMLHYTEPTLALQEAFRVVRPGGHLMVAAAIVPSEDIKPLWEEFKSVTQPLRLRVFTEANLAYLIEEAGFNIQEVRNMSLLRTESFENIAQRAVTPPSGWPSFLRTMERVFFSISPELEFEVRDSQFSYRQFWCTLVAQKPTVFTK